VAICPRMQKVMSLWGCRSSKDHATVLYRLRKQTELPRLCGLADPEEMTNCKAVNTETGEEGPTYLL
jgi:hypothetical protein